MVPIVALLVLDWGRCRGRGAGRSSKPRGGESVVCAPMPKTATSPRVRHRTKAFDPQKFRKLIKSLLFEWLIIAYPILT
jgi:hypothetical protein